jgi:hypothetical protein
MQLSRSPAQHSALRRTAAPYILARFYRGARARIGVRLLSNIDPKTSVVRSKLTQFIRGARWHKVIAIRALLNKGS